MGKIGKGFVLLFTIILLSSLTTYQSANAQTATDDKYVITDTDAIITLSENASTTNATYFPAHFSSVDCLYIPAFWMFTNFSTGNGTVNLAVSANNCKMSIASFNYLTRNGSEQYAIYTDSWLNYTVEGKGNQTVDYTYLYSASPERSQDVYIDGVAKQQGDGWSPAHIGITITGATSRVSIHQASVDYFPPRNPPHLELIDYLLPIGVILAVIIILSILLLRRHRKNTNLR